MNHTSYVLSNRPHKFDPIKTSMHPEPVTYFNGDGYPSFSKIINECVTNCPTEIVIMMGDKVLPSSQHVTATVNLLNQGYAFVGLYRFGFFGFTKELFRRIGMMDERFVGGGCEDEDIYLRLKEANLAAYITQRVPYFKMPSSWDYSKSRPHFFTKWVADDEANTITRTMPDEVYDYDLGPSVPVEWMPWDKSYLKAKKAMGFIKYDIK